MSDNPNSFDARATLSVDGRSYEIFRLDALQSKFDIARLPFSLKILLENLLRNEDGEAIHAADACDRVHDDPEPRPTGTTAWHGISLDG